MTSRESNPLSRMFAGLSEYVFHSKLGVVDTELVDYVTSLLVRFSRYDGVQRIRSCNGTPATEVLAMVEEAENRVGDAKREVHRHIGDYTLFWSGVYPESLQGDNTPQVKDPFISYCAQGKRAYRVASSIASLRPMATSALLSRMSDQFEMCAYGLREIRREWERRDSEDGDSTLLF